MLDLKQNKLYKILYYNIEKGDNMRRFVLKRIIIVIYLFLIACIAMEKGINGVIAVIIFLAIFLTTAHKFLFKRINSMFTINRFTKEIGQSVKMNLLLKLIFTDNYCKGRYSELLRSEKRKAIKDLEEYLVKTKVRKLKTTTNMSMYTSLKRIERKGIIQVNEIKSLGKKRQPNEKLVIYGGITLIKNLTNKKFWKFIFNEEDVSKYEILILKNN
jgi:flagellin-like protein